MLIQNPPAEIGGSMWMLGTTAYPLYLVRGRGAGAIVEGGIGALGSLLCAQLTQLGLGEDYIRQAVITHAHPDHVMAIPLLREMFPGISVVASQKAAATLSAEKAVAFFRQVDGLLTDVLSKAGQIGDEPPQPPPLTENRIAVDRTVCEGDEIAVDGIAWTVLETPGHSDCSISLHDPARRTLIISDATGYYMPGGGESGADAWWPNYFTGYAAYLASIERLAQLDAEIVCLSHNGAICGADDVRSYFAGALAATRAYHDRIVAEARSGKPARQIAEELGIEIHGQTRVLPVDFFQKNCGLLVKQSLRYEEEGLGIRDWQGRSIR